MIFWLKQPFPPEFLQVHLRPPDSLPPKKASCKRAYHYHWLWKLSPLTSINCAECTHWTVQRPFIKFPRSSSSLPYHFCNKPLFSPLSDCQAQRFDLKGKIIHKWYIDVPPEGQMMIFLLLWKNINLMLTKLTKRWCHIILVLFENVPFHVSLVVFHVCQ